MRSSLVVQAISQPVILMQLYAKKELGWEAEYGIDEMCADSWRWQSMNPDGYGA